MALWNRYGNTALSTGQVEGGRWKPLHYLLRATTYRDQLGACNHAGECFIANDSPRQFLGAVSLRLINVQSGVSATMQIGRRVDLRPGAGTVEWFCAASNASSLVTSAGSYHYYPCQRPVAGVFTVVGSAPAMTHTQCQAACTTNSSCAGFTRPSPGVGCHFFVNQAGAFSSFRLGNNATVDWWQKTSVATFPGEPSNTLLQCVPLNVLNVDLWSEQILLRCFRRVPFQSRWSAQAGQKSRSGQQSGVSPRAKTVCSRSTSRARRHQSMRCR